MKIAVEGRLYHQSYMLPYLGLKSDSVVRLLDFA